MSKSLNANKYGISQGFGGNTGYYLKYGYIGHPVYNSIRYFSYLPDFGVIVSPLLKTLDGILKTLYTLLFNKPMHSTKSDLSAQEFSAKNAHQPVCLEGSTGLPRLVLRLYRLAVFKSIRSPFHQKSKGVLRLSEGRFAPYLRINHSSQTMPSWGFPVKTLRTGRVFLMYQARLIQRTLQYFFRASALPQNSHNIFRYYQMKGHNANGS